jgi:hypothetical protein
MSSALLWVALPTNKVGVEGRLGTDRGSLDMVLGFPGLTVPLKSCQSLQIARHAREVYKERVSLHSKPLTLLLRSR